MSLKKIKVVEVTPLSPAERTRYQALKKSILDHIDPAHSALMRVARDLKTIRDERLYREEADTFEDWCLRVIGKQRATFTN
jgi:hypothetical protein